LHLVSLNPDHLQPGCTGTSGAAGPSAYRCRQRTLHGAALPPRAAAARLLAVLTVGIGTSALAADTPPAPPKPAPPGASDCAAWNEVERFRGFYTCSRVHHQSFSSAGESVSNESSLVGDATFELALAPNSKWTWKVAQGNISGSFAQDSATRRTFYHGSNHKTGGFAGSVNDLTLMLDVRHCRWSFEAAGKLPQPYTFTDHAVSVHTDDPRQNIDRTENIQSTAYPHAGISGTLPPNHVGPVRGNWDKTIGSMTTGLDEFHATVVLVPEFKDLTLEVKIEGVAADGSAVPYDKWIPRGTLTGAPGSGLKVKARLQRSDGGPVPAAVQVDKFTFKLDGTSREPGVCMNHPLDAAKAGAAAPDLRFAPDGGQQADRPPVLTEAGHPSAEARIECLDYGAWADLTVTAALVDGRVITGHLAGDPAAVVMLLPKRTGGSHIADAWKSDHGIAAGTSDDDDSEKLPVGGRTPGDGFTLYEEYRGFVADGKYLAGDPEKIDFFVNNRIGADAVPGIELFAEVTGAEVHSRLSDSEFNPNQRVVNGNHREGAHRVDQHGVVLYTEPNQDGAEAHFSQAGVRGRPRLCIGIAVQPRGASTAINTSENVPVSDLVFAYDRAILHELLHAVGVEHHGKGDGSTMFTFVFADDPRNKTGKPLYWMGYTSYQHVVKIIDESTGRDYAEEQAPAYEQERARGRQELWSKLVAEEKVFRAAREGYTFEYTFDQQVLIDLDRMFGWTFWYVGAEHGQGSGVEDCVMRYYFANLYEKKGADDTFYFITKKRAERIGEALCRSQKGTGINASSRQPQPRYGDALAGCGECADWVVFSDAVPPDPAP
jgi:hypothetical protein